MKRVLAGVAAIIILAGCKSHQSDLSPGLALRNKVQKANVCSFDAVVTADYGEKIYSFSMSCKTDATGDCAFEVTAPETISGITGTVSADGGKLTFDEEVLAFPLLADGQITPVSAPWLLMQTLKGGYLRACEQKSDGAHLVIDDSYDQDALQMDIYLDISDLPVRGEILHKGRRIVSMDVQNFQCQ